MLHPSVCTWCCWGHDMPLLLRAVATGSGNPPFAPLGLLALPLPLVLTECRLVCRVLPPSLLPSFAFIPSRPHCPLSTLLSPSSHLRSSSSLSLLYPPSPSAMLVLSLPPSFVLLPLSASSCFPSPPRRSAALWPPTRGKFKPFTRVNDEAVNKG